MGFVAPAASHAAAPDDQQPFEAWLRPLLPSVWLFVCRFAQRQDREDVYQSTLLAAWRKRHLYDPSRSSQRTWLLVLAGDQCRKARRQLLRRPLPSLLALPEDTDVDGAIDIRRAVRRLTKRQRVAVELFYVMDLTVTDCSRVMGCSVGTVKSTLSDARAALRRQLGDGP